MSSLSKDDSSYTYTSDITDCMGLLSICSELDVAKHATSTVNFTILIIFVWRDPVLLINKYLYPSTF